MIGLDTFKARVQESGKACSDFNTEVFFASERKETAQARTSPGLGKPGLPPRLVSDQMINIFFQEWAPLFPIVHRPTILKLYTEYLADPHGIVDDHTVAQLNLIFGIAALSAEVQIIIS